MEDASLYGERIAPVYDELYSEVDDGQVGFLAELAGPGPVLELGIGTGRLALPLVRRGLEVHGIDASPSMVAGLRAKPGGEGLPVTVGDFGEVDVEQRYSLVFVAFNTFFALASQEEQVRCFANVAAHLAEDGLFLIEAFVPDPGRFRRHQNVTVTRVEESSVWIDVARHDAVAQRVHSQHVALGAGGVRLFPVSVRYAWPSELDLMGRLAGLRLRERWGGWRRQPFTGDSSSHVSVYGRDGA